jgi:hypothetical protein
MRLKILILISVLTLMLTFWAWSTNPFQLDIAATKNRRLIHERTKEITAMTNIDSLKQRTFQIINQLDKRNLKKDQIVMNVQNLLTVTILLNVVSITLLVVEIRRRKIDS